MIKFFKNFRKDESGAVTVDWVVLTAAVAALAGVVYSGISSGTNDVVNATNTYLNATSLDVTAEGAIGTTTP